MRLVSRTGVIVSVLAVGAIAAPVASADPSHSGWNPAPSSWVVGPNPDQQVAEPAAAPAVLGYPSTRVVTSNPDQQLSQVTTRSRGGLTQSLSGTRANTPTGSQGFHFDDAAIGAGVVVGLMLIGTAGVLTIRRRSQLQQP